MEIFHGKTEKLIKECNGILNNGPWKTWKFLWKPQNFRILLFLMFLDHQKRIPILNMSTKTEKLEICKSDSHNYPQPS